MSPERRAVIFDLDDTLYPFRRFLVSGFAAVAAHLGPRHGVNPRLLLRTLIRLARGDGRGRELQRCFETFGLPAAEIDAEVERLRHHPPALRLSADAAGTLALLRRRRWRLGILTNGPRDIQVRKIAALGIASSVDAVVFAPEVGRGVGKPDAEPFREIARQLDVPAASAVMVGDDEQCDVLGARAAGMHPVRCGVWRPVDGPTAAVVVIDRLAQVPQVAHALVTGDTTRHVA
jgi:putative hydrolase of the HAD superfamily